MWDTTGEVKTNVLSWTPTPGHTSVGQPSKNYIYHLCANIRCFQADLPGDIEMNGKSESELSVIRMT